MDQFVKMVLLLLTLSIGITVAKDCIDNQKHQIKIKAKLDCEGFSGLIGNHLEEACKRDKQGVKKQCCQTCLNAGVKTGNKRQCQDDKEYNTRLTMKMSCKELAAWKPKTMKKECSNVRKTISEECCESCQDLGLGKNRNECLELKNCPHGAVRKGPCSHENLNYLHYSFKDYKTNTLWVIFNDESIVNYSGDLCLTAKFSPTSGTKVSKIQLILREIKPTRMLQEHITPVDENIPDVPLQISFPSKTSGLVLQMIMLYQGSASVKWDFKASVMTKMVLHACSCAELS